jgi:predicted NBD/HSP70 family sugar kinase
MYLGIDIGGTKTIVARLDDRGVILESRRFPTPKEYRIFLKALEDNVAKLSSKEAVACCAAVPGLIDRQRGICKALGNLPWRDVPIQKDIQAIVKCPTTIENDANLAGLSEAMLLKQYERVFYITISTGIGSGYIVNRTIEPSLANSEAGHMVIEYQDKLQRWEDFASGRAIVKRFGKRAADITDERTWKIISHAIALGLIDIIATVQPEVIVFGGGVDTYFERFKPHLEAELKKYDTPMTPIPPLLPASRPEDAVVYGCYDLAKQLYG